MKNKYKEEISKYKVSSNVKEKIYTKIEQPVIKRFKVAYGVIALILTCIISIGIVYAEDIKEFIECWGKMKVDFYLTDNKKESVELDQIEIVSTALDNYIFDEETFDELEIVDGFYPVPKENVTYFPNKSLNEIEEILNRKILGINNLKYEYSYSEITSERRIGSIFIKSDNYIIKCGKRGGKESCLPIANGYKGLSISVEIKTKNAVKKEHGMNEYGYDFSHDEINPSIKIFDSIGNIKVKGFSHIIPLKDSDGTINEFYTDMFFNYDNIRYTVNAINLTHDEIIDILSKNLK